MLVVKINSIIICQTTIIHHILKKWNVYATRKILDPAIPIIAKECSVVLNNKARPPTRSELLAGVCNKDAVLCTLSDKIDQMVTDAARSSLKVISSYSTGVDHICCAFGAMNWLIKCTKTTYPKNKGLLDMINIE